jgi:hypothetical protein
MYEYEPRVDEESNATEAYRDFQNYLFSHPYGFVWDFPADKVIIYGIAYRISSLRRIPDTGQTTCLCLCGTGGGNGNGTGIAKITTDASLQGEGSEAAPLGVQLSQKAGNRLLVLDDGCYVGSEPLPYTPPVVELTSSVPQGEYLTGETLSDMTLTVTVTAGTESIRDVRIFEGKKTLHVFPLAAGSHEYTFELPAGVDRDTTFSASVSDGMEYISNSLQYTFVLPVFCGVSDTKTVSEAVIIAETPFKTSGSSFEHIYGSFKKQFIWMACPESRIIKTVADENGLNITTAFKKLSVKIILAEEQYKYSLYVFDTKTTGSNYKVTFHS